MTGNMTTIARPYAIAAFEYAKEHTAIPAWETLLDEAALITEDAELQQLLTMPSVTSKQISELYCDILASKLNPEMKNFIHLLAEYHRLAALPEVANLFKSYRQETDKTLTVQVTSSTSLDSDYQQKLAQALTKRLQRQVSLECNVDANLIGGAVITAGDTVIDGSVRGKLNRLLIDFIS